MSRFADRWRTLARTARRAPAPSPPREEWLETLLETVARNRPAPDPEGAPWAPRWAAPAAVVLLYALALPVLGAAWTTASELAVTPIVLPHPPAVPPPPAMTPPSLPPPPVVPGSAALLDSLMKEMQP